MALYEEIADTLRDRIRNRTYTHRLPSIPALTEEFGASVNTIRAAEKLLAAQGWIRIAQGEGAFVSTSPPRPVEDPTKALESTLKQIRTLVDQALTQLRRRP